MHRVIFFDWDNTLISFGSFLVNILKQVADEMGEKPISPIKVPTKTKKDTLFSIFGHKWIEAEKLFDDKYTTQKPEKFNALPGAGELLEKICRAQIPLGIISNKKTSEIMVELKQQFIESKTFNSSADISWESFINILTDKFIIIGSDRVHSPKPDSEAGLTALKHLKIPYEKEPVQILHIGDGGLESDVGFAKKLNEVLYKFQPQSSCKSLLFNLYVDEYDKVESEKCMHSQEELSKIPYDYISHGYGRVGQIVSNFVNPNRQKLSDELTTMFSQIKSTAITQDDNNNNACNLKH